MTLAGCVANPHRFAEQLDHRADAAGLVRYVVQGTAFSHIVYRRATVLQSNDLASNDLAPDELPPDASPTDNAVTLVYLEGDGMPSSDGMHAAVDPTPKHALAFELMAQTKQRAWYVTRPCYNSMLREPNCDAALWTHARYSTTVVDSMVAALTRHAQAQGNPRLVLVGYSGGGVLAVLMASRVPNVVGVITVAANLDTEGWTTHHNYSPLIDSLNPATDTATLAIPAIHFMGGRDTKVPVASAARYFAAHPQAILWKYEKYDHVCCWKKDWPTLVDRALRQIAPP